MRRYFTFRIKGGSFEAEVSALVLGVGLPWRTAESIAKSVIRDASSAFGCIPVSRLELVSWREA